MLEAQQDPEAAYGSAVQYCAGAAERVGKTLDWAEGAAAEALRYRFWFELYVAVEGEAVAKDKERQADRYLAQLLGDSAVAEAGAAGANLKATMPAVGVVKPGRGAAGLDGFPGRRYPR